MILIKPYLWKIILNPASYTVHLFNNISFGEKQRQKYIYMYCLV